MPTSRVKEFTIARGAPFLGLLVAIAFCCGGAMAARADPRPGLRDFQAGRFADAFAAWHDAAERGDGTSALYLGVLYDSGIGVPQDEPEALSWYERGAAEGNATAMFNAGVMHDAGRGTASDPAAAVQWYRRAALRGVARADYNLALLYQGGLGVPASRSNAIRFYRAAAGQGITAARMHLHELGVSFTEAPRRRTLDLAMVNFKHAQDLLLRRGVGEAATAFKFFRAAAEAGNPLAAYNVAYYYQHGIGVAPNLEQALNWYRRSAAGATDPAIRQLAAAALRNLQNRVAQAQH